jgi:hypothetical protein
MKQYYSQLSVGVWNSQIRSECNFKIFFCINHWIKMSIYYIVPPDHLLLDRSPNIGPLISCWELDKFKNCWNKSFRTSKILTLLYQKFSNLLISQQAMSGPRLGALSNNRWSGGIYRYFLTKRIEISRLTPGIIVPKFARKLPSLGA